MTYTSQAIRRGCGGEPAWQHPASAEIAIPKLLLLFALHVPLALLMVRFPETGRLHAWGTLLVGAAWAMNASNPARVLGIVAYIAGSEVLWRMTSAPIFWEFGKYAVVAVLLVAIQRTRPSKTSTLPIVYFALLLPSIMMTIVDADAARVRKEISFNLSGPLALALCAAYCARVQLSIARLQRVLLAFLAPVVAIVTVVLFHFSKVANVKFSGESSHLASGGYGPNQVSSVLGLGALAAFLLAAVIFSPKQHRFRWLMVAVAVWLLGQSALTLSRSGLYLAAGGAAVAMSFGLRDARARNALIVTVGMLYVVGAYVVAPRLDEFTGGAMSRRFADTGLTGRDLIMQADMALWMKHPLLGVGPGMAKENRGNYFRVATAHTEITRLVAEHGALGAVALCLLLVGSWQAVKRAESRRTKAFCASMIVYGFLYMFSNGMRLVLPSLALGLAFLVVRDE